MKFCPILVHFKEIYSLHHFVFHHAKDGLNQIFGPSVQIWRKKEVSENFLFCFLFTFSPSKDETCLVEIGPYLDLKLIKSRSKKWVKLIRASWSFSVRVSTSTDEGTLRRSPLIYQRCLCTLGSSWTGTGKVLLKVEMKNRMNLWRQKVDESFECFLANFWKFLALQTNF